MRVSANITREDVLGFLLFVFCISCTYTL